MSKKEPEAEQSSSRATVKSKAKTHKSGKNSLKKEDNEAQSVRDKVSPRGSHLSSRVGNGETPVVLNLGAIEIEYRRDDEDIEESDSSEGAEIETERRAGKVLEKKKEESSAEEEEEDGEDEEELEVAGGDFKEKERIGRQEEEEGTREGTEKTGERRKAKAKAKEARTRSKQRGPKEARNSEPEGSGIYHDRPKLQTKQRPNRTIPTNILRRKRRGQPHPPKAQEAQEEDKEEKIKQRGSEGRRTNFNPIQKFP
jgi:hypothetical protein